MYCPKCEWNVVSFVVETRRWICKRCKYEWTERSKPSTTFRSGQSTMKTRSLAAKARKGKSPVSKTKKKISRAKTAGAKRRR